MLVIISKNTIREMILLNRVVKKLITTNKLFDTICRYWVAKNLKIVTNREIS